ncbi:hypothetical protein GALL_479530 [mine drainage metagenome]|uniref:Uncharacterized protein n=1 Tax=mine drainage metagenome TaxID=410659 RepID=A0A1J5PYT1_9ZZZZ
MTFLSRGCILLNVQGRYTDRLLIFSMETSELLRHQKIESLMARPMDNVADAGVELWEQMATQIISIIGENGFNSLYERSVFLTQSSFPWLAADALSSRKGHRFAELKMRLEGQAPAQACEANVLLLITFTDILVTLIGEQLTTSILRSAWGSEASDKAGKEFQNG